jgi:hypothetical protein
MPVTKSHISPIIPAETIISKIFYIRGQKVVLDYDLATLYGVETKVLNQTVKRNMDRFSEEFMFRLTTKEWIQMRSQFVTASSQTIDLENNTGMRSQIVTSSLEPKTQKKRKVSATPFAFTEHGLAMVANVLRSDRAVKMSIVIVKTFIQLKKQAFDYKKLAEQIEIIKLQLGEHNIQLNSIYETMENLLDDKVERDSYQKRRRIGFRPDD